MKKLHTSDKSNETLTFVENYLLNWSKWIKTGHSSKSSSPKTVNKGLIHNGIKPISPPTSTHDYSIFEAIEKSICKMPGYLRKVIRKYYLSPGSVTQKAKELNIARVTFHEYLRMAKYWLLGYWSNKPLPA